MCDPENVKLVFSRSDLARALGLPEGVTVASFHVTYDPDTLQVRLNGHQGRTDIGWCLIDDCEAQIVPLSEVLR